MVSVLADCTYMHKPLPPVHVHVHTVLCYRSIHVNHSGQCYQQFTGCEMMLTEDGGNITIYMYSWWYSNKREEKRGGCLMGLSVELMIMRWQFLYGS